MARILRTIRYDDPRPLHVRPYFKEETWNNRYPVVLIHRKVLLDIYQHAKSEMQHEVGGYLLGAPAEDVDSGQRVVYVGRAVRGVYHSSATHVTLAEQSMVKVEEARQQDGTLLLVGWYHSHPGLGVFYSGTDISNHRKHHPEKYQIGIVVDPSKMQDEREIFDPESKWIGFWGWSAEGKVEELPLENIGVLDAAPSFGDTEKKEVDRSKQQVMGEKLWDGFHLLGMEGKKWLTQELPVMIIQRSTVEKARRAGRREGILFGNVVQVNGGIRLFIVMDVLPCPYRKWKTVGLLKALQECGYVLPEGIANFLPLGGYEVPKRERERVSRWREIKRIRYLRQAFGRPVIFGSFGAQHEFYIARWCCLTPLPKGNVILVGGGQ